MSSNIIKSHRTPQVQRPQGCSPITEFIPLPITREPSSGRQVISIQQRDTSLHELAPDCISRTHRPSWRVPVPPTNPLVLGNLQLTLQRLQLRRIELGAVNLPDIARELCRRDGADVTRDVGLRCAEERQVRIEEVVPVCDGGDLVERGVACSDDRDGAFGDVGAVVGCEVAGAAEWFERADDVGECLCAVGLEVDPQVEGLAGGGVEDAVVSLRGLECGRGVLALED